MIQESRVSKCCGQMKPKWNSALPTVWPKEQHPHRLAWRWKHAWSCFSACTGHLQSTGPCTIKILDQNLLPSTWTLKIGCGWVFQEDLKHSTKRTKDWLKTKNQNGVLWTVLASLLSGRWKVCGESWSFELMQNILSSLKWTRDHFFFLWENFHHIMISLTVISPKTC